MEAIGEMVERLARRLGERGHLSAEASQAMAAGGREAARDLPAGKVAGRALGSLIADTPYAYENLAPEEVIDEWMGDMTITKTGSGSLLFTGYDDPPQDMTLPVPAELNGQIGDGWTVWVRLVLTEDDGWQFNQFGTVFP